MERVKIKLPSNFIFSTIEKIRITDLNFGGHVGNDTFLSLLHEARHKYLKQAGCSEIFFEGFGLIMTDAVIEYKKELVDGDEIKISVAADGFDKFGFDIFYKMEIVTTTTNILSAKAKTGMLCFDYTSKKLIPLPEVAKLKLQNSERKL